MNQSSSSEFTISKKESKQKKIVSKDDIEREGRWLLQQNLKYLVFLNFNLSKFECKKKRMFRLYKPLSKFIVTRNSEQCRSHHRKMLQRFKTPKRILFFFGQKFKQEDIQQMKQKSVEVLKQLKIPQKKIKPDEKQEIVNEKGEQKNVFCNQNNPSRRNEFVQKKSDIMEEEKEGNSVYFPSLNLSSPHQTMILNYQALGWFNQIYAANRDNFLGQNGYNYYYG